MSDHDLLRRICRTPEDKVPDANRRSRFAAITGIYVLLLAAIPGPLIVAHQDPPSRLLRQPIRDLVLPGPAEDVLPEQPAHLRAIGLQDLPSAEAGEGVVIALIDVGIDAEHPSLAGRLLPTVVLADGDVPPGDPGGHGTALAGLLVSAPRAPMPIFGLVPGARVLPIQVGTTLAPPDGAAVARGIREGCGAADVVLVGLAGFTSSPELDVAVSDLARQGCLIVAPAGNQGLHQLPAPASLAGAIAVAALDAGGLLSGQANLDVDAVAVAAPGRALTLAPDDGRAEINGSSAAAALVAGALAWVISEQGDLAFDVARTLLRDTARPLDDEASQILDFGRLDIPAMRAAVRPGAGPALSVIDVRLAPVRPRPGQDFDVEVEVRNRGSAPSAANEIVVEVDELSVSAALDPLAAGATITRSLRLTALAAGGERILNVSLGSGGQPPLSVPMIVDPSEAVEIALTSLTLSATPIAGGPRVDLVAMVENWGNVEARDVEIAFLLDDEALARQSIPRLSVGERQQVTVPWDPDGGSAGAIVNLLAVAAAAGTSLDDNGVLMRDVLIASPEARLRPQYADKAGVPIEFVTDAPFYSVDAMDYLPVLAFFPQIDLPRRRGERRSNVTEVPTPCQTRTVTLLGRPFQIRRSDPQVLGLSILDLNRLGKALVATGPRQLRRSEARQAVADATVFAVSTRRRPLVAGPRDRPEDRTPRLESVDGLSAVDERGERVTDSDLASRLLCPRETSHVVFRVPKESLLSQTLFQSMPAGSVPAALEDRQNTPHLQLDVELHLITNPLAGKMKRNQRQALFLNGPIASMSQRQVSYVPGQTAIKGHKRVRKQLLVQLGDSLPLPPAGGQGKVREDRYVDAHFHTIAEYVGLELELSKRPLAPFKAFGGPLQMLAESAASVGLVPWAEVPVSDGGPDIRPELLRHKVLATDHNVFYSESEDPRYYGEGVPPVLADLLDGTNGTRTELELFRETFGLALGEELTLRPFAAEKTLLLSPDPAGEDPQDDPHGLSFLDLSFEGPWYGGKAFFRKTVNLLSNVSDLDRVPDNPNTLRNVLAQARCARLPQATCLTCCQSLSGAEVISDGDLQGLCATQACTRGYRTGREPFLYAAHPFAKDFLWNRDGFEVTDLASGTGSSPLRKDGRDRSLVTVDDNFLYKGAQIWNRRAPLSISRLDLPLRRLQAPYPVFAAVANFLLAGDDDLEINLFLNQGERQYSDTWLDELLTGQSDWMQRNSEGLRFSFEGDNDARDVKLVRKLYAAGGTDAHGDFNYQEDILSTATDVGFVKKIAGSSTVQAAAELAGFDFAHQQLQANNAFGAVRTLLLTADKPTPAGFADGPGQPSAGASDIEKRAVQALADGNTVITDGPAIDFTMDADGRFDSAAKTWHSGINIHQNRDGRIGGQGRFDGGRSMLVANGYAVLDETGSGGFVDDGFGGPGSGGRQFFDWFNDGIEFGIVQGVVGTVRPLQVLSPLLHPGPSSLTPLVALENRGGGGYPDVFYSFGWNNPQATGGKPIAVHLYRGTPIHVPSLDQPTRRFTLGEIPGPGVVHREWKVSRFASQSSDTDGTDRISDLSYTYAEALTGSATPRTARHRAITNPVWSIPVGIRISLEKPLISAPLGLSATIPACGLRIEYNFPISMKAGAYPIKLKQLDENGDSLDDELPVTFLPLSPICEALDNQGWTPRAKPRDPGSVRHSKYTVRNDQPIVVAGPFFPGPANFPTPGRAGGSGTDLESSLDAQRLLRSFVVYFNAANSTSGPVDFHDNPLNSIAALFTVELVPLSIIPPIGDPLPPLGDPLPPLEEIPRLPGDGIPLPGGTVERPRPGTVLGPGTVLRPGAPRPRPGAPPPANEG